VSAATPLIAPTGPLETRPFVGDRYLLVGAGLTGGAAYAVLHDFIRQVGAEIFHVAAEDLYAALNRLAAATPPGSDGLLCDPRFTGTRHEPNRRGSFSNLAPANFTPGHLARALLEGMAIAFHALYEAMLAAGARPRQRLIGAGNGMRRNPLLARIVAERFALPLATPRHTEEAAVGAALLASVAAGEHSLASAGDLIRYEEG
jgi:sugar (pentulose or hexulose) kinase